MTMPPPSSVFRFPLRLRLSHFGGQERNVPAGFRGVGGLGILGLADDHVEGILRLVWMTLVPLLAQIPPRWID